MAPAIAVAFTTGTISLGGAISFLPGIITSDASSHNFLVEVGVGSALLALAVSAIFVGVRLWFRRRRLLDSRGTAYIVNESAKTWTYEEKRNFSTRIQTEFAHIIRVPGPDELGSNWKWPLDENAHKWSGKVDELVYAFWAVQYNDNQRTRNSLFIWAWWSVSLAFTLRAISGRRGLVLGIRRRPSEGRAGRLDPEAWREPPKSFTIDPSLPDVGAPGAIWKATANFGSDDPTAKNAASPKPATLLLVRMSPGAWGPIPPGDETPAQPIHLTLRDAGGNTGLTGTVDLEFREWRAFPDTRHHAWENYEPLAQSAARWISAVWRERGGVVLLGMVAMPEAVAGIGILATQMGESWPEHLWPVMWNGHGGPMVIPDLDLGRSATRYWNHQ
ncbi:hypothetical protein [Phytoactinopolyspora limicola]|uniref:hypothetical protein n=1 Tax=Phytoactinopolyspora limicola TaxID=2715536 RepID=UPI00140C34A6|nr:hypothetical protein [Phytoactinopolyspora limicola]